MPPVGFEPAIPASESQQKNTSDLAATGIGTLWEHSLKAQRGFRPNV